MDFNKYSPAAKFISAGVVSICTALWGKADIWLLTLLAFMAVDQLSGLGAAWIEQKLSSEVGYKGILKKLLMLLVVAVGNLLDNAMGAGGTIRSLVIGFYIANEGISLLENAARCGVPFPKKLLDALIQLRGDSDGSSPSA